MDNEKLIYEVQRFPVLYDCSLSAYKENTKKGNAWQNTTSIIGVPSERI